MMKARTKIVLKTQTDALNMDHEFPKGTKISRIIVHLISMVLIAEGSADLKAAIDREFERYEKRQAEKADAHASS